MKKVKFLTRITIVLIALFAFAALPSCVDSGTDIPPEETTLELPPKNPGDDPDLDIEPEPEVWFENVKVDPQPVGVSQYELSNSNAIPNAKNLYNYLVDLSKQTSTTEKLIVGYYISAAYRGDVNPQYPFSMSEPTEIRRRTGKWVGLLDAWICPGVYPEGKKNIDPFKDCMWYDQVVADYRLWWLNGGILHAGSSPYCPSFSGHNYTAVGKYGERHEESSGNQNLNYDNLVNDPGSVERKRWTDLLDHISTFFLELQQYDIPIIYRPFTETYIDNYWYSSCPWGDRPNPDNAWATTNAQFKALWKLTRQYLIDKGCNNIIWDFQRRTNSQDTHYPGDDVVDVLAGESDYVHWGGDCYRPGYADPGDKPVGNGELGTYGVSDDVIKDTPDRVGIYTWESYIQTISETAPRMCFFTVWNRKFGPVKFPAVLSGKTFNYPDYDTGFDALMDHSAAVTRDKLKAAPEPPKLPFRMTFGFGRPMPITFPKSGDWQYENKTLVRKDVAGRSVAVYGNTDWADYSTSTVVTVPNSGEVGLIGRCTSVNQYYSLSVDGSKLKLIKYANYKNNAAYTPITLASATFSPTKGDEIKLILTFKGDSIMGTVEPEGGEPLHIMAKDDLMVSGCIGVFSLGSATFKSLQAW